MSPIVSRFALLSLLTSFASGCGLYQSTSDTSRAVMHSLFYKQITTLHLDFSGRASLNTDQRDMTGLSVPTLVRVYQLRDAKLISRATYDSVLFDSGALSGDLLDERMLVVKPEEGAQLSVPMDKAAQAVAVVALFRQPDQAQNTWRLVLTRDDLHPDRARVIELADNQLNLRPLPQM